MVGLMLRPLALILLVVWQCPPVPAAYVSCEATVLPRAALGCGDPNLVRLHLGFGAKDHIDGASQLRRADRFRNIDLHFGDVLAQDAIDGRVLRGDDDDRNV